MSKPEVNIEDWYILGKILYGKAQNHPRFAKDTEIRTSTIVDMPRSPKQGDKVETMNTVYILGEKPMTDDLPATPPADEALRKLEKLIGPRCETLDKHDFPDLKEGERCANCEIWEAIDAIKSHAEQEKAAAVLEAERYGRSNEHHVITGIMTNEDLAALSTATIKRLKQRQKELAELRDDSGSIDV